MARSVAFTQEAQNPAHSTLLEPPQALSWHAGGQAGCSAKGAHLQERPGGCRSSSSTAGNA